MTDSLSSPAHRGQNMPINLLQKLKQVNAHWQPRVVAEMNDYQFKIVKVEGDFVWHTHTDTDEAFLVLEGVLRIDFRDRSMELSAGEMAVVPQGAVHKTYAAKEAKLLLIERAGVVNTGHADTDRTAPDDIWI